MNHFLKTFLCALVILFAVSVGIGIGALVSGGTGDFDRPGVAVVNVEGVILDSAPYLESIRRIRADDSVKAVVVRINSPGGAVASSQEIYEEIRRLGEDVPVVASMGTVAASGGYYVACAASGIYANPGTVTGSIGVIARFANYEQLLEWARIDVEVIKSGRMKDAGSPLREMSGEERAYLQGLMDEVHEQFRETVAAARGLDRERVASLSDGRIVTGATAVGLGLVDGTGTLETALAEARRLGGLEDDAPAVEYPRKRHPLLELLSPESSARRLFASPARTGFGLFYLAGASH